MKGKTLRRSQEARRQVAEYSEQIHALARMLELADRMDPVKPKLDPQAVAQIGRMIARDICRLGSCLDDLAWKAPRGPHGLQGIRGGR